MKICSWCQKEKTLDEFAFRNKAKGTRRAQCKACISEWDKKNYQRPSKAEAIKENRTARIQELRAKIWEHKKSNPCVDCGESDPRVLEFDHLENKLFNICEAPQKGFSWKKVMEEIEKCEVVCANHHKIRTWERGGWTR